MIGWVTAVISDIRVRLEFDNQLSKLRLQVEHRTKVLIFHFHTAL